MASALVNDDFAFVWGANLRLNGPMPDLVMIPAMGCDGRLYADIAPRLSAAVKPITLVTDKNAMADCVQQVLAGAPERFVVLGTSFGGRTALEVALAAPERVQGLIVIGAGAGAALDQAAGLKRAERLRGTEFGKVVAEMAGMISHLPGPRGPSARDCFIAMAQAMGGEAMARQAEAMAGRLDLRPRLGEITCPALMLWGREDQFSPAAEGLKISMALPHGHYVAISACGHFPSLEAPEETTHILLHWLRDSELI